MNANDILKYGHFTFLGSLEGISEPDLEVGGVCGVWSVRDITAHLTSYEHVLSEVLQGLAGGAEDTPYLKQFTAEGFNDAQVAARKSKSTVEVLDEYKSAHGRNMELVAQIPAETLRQVGTIPWYGADYAVDDFIVYAFYGHKREHSAQIDAFRDTFKKS